MATIRKRNNRWQVMIRRKDAAQISKSFHRKSEAELWAREMEIKADRGALRDDPRILSKISLGELLIRYLNTISIDKAGAEIEGYVINAFCKSPLSKRSLASLNPSDFAEYRDQRLKEVSGSTVNRQMSIIHHAFELAVKEWGLPLSVNPMSQIRKPKNNPPRVRRLKAGEYHSLLVAASSCQNSQVKKIIILAVATAMRRGEILNIHDEHICFRTKHLLIPKTKTGAQRNIPLSDEAILLLSNHMSALSCEQRQLFPMSPNAFRLAWQKVKIRAGIKDLHFHDLRHEAVSRLFEQGLGVAHVAAISGHKDFRMLARYTHLNPE